MKTINSISMAMTMSILIAPGCTTSFDVPEDSHSDTSHDTQDTGTDSVNPPCGGPSGGDCPADFLCEIGEGLCDPSMYEGVCIPVPGGCPDIWDPVCGCDNVTYANDCERQMAWQFLAYRGECWVPTVCEPFVTGYCNDSEFCEAPSGLCYMTGVMGLCLPRTSDCEYTGPQCGCDGVTYDNACTRWDASALLDHEGPCGMQGCISDTDCPPGSSPRWFCEFEPGVCGVNTNSHCVPVPEWCDPMDDNPVCDCTNTPWANNCVRRQAQAQIAFIGTCY